MMKELWKFIKITENKFLISSYGRIMNATTRVVRKQKKSKRGYMCITIRMGGGFKTIYPHKEVVKAFLKYKPGLEINHIDSNKTNNNVDNLEMVSHRENRNHFHNMSGHKDHGCIKRNGKFISQYGNNGKMIYIGTFNSMKEARTSYLKEVKKINQHKYA